MFAGSSGRGGINYITPSEGEVASRRGIPTPDAREGQSALYIAASEGHSRSVDRLLHEGADPDWAFAPKWGAGGWTALHVAAHRGNKGCVAVLLAHGASVDAAAADGRTALMSAAEKFGTPLWTSGNHPVAAPAVLVRRRASARC